jgi:stearoyl-CoA desaturase (delta-9 desaturase)
MFGWPHEWSALFFAITYLIPPLLIVKLASSGWYPTCTQIALVFAETVCIIGGCMSICLHRYCAHRAFKASRFTQAIIVTCGCFAYQGNPIWWASKHRRHHTYCDSHQDPHSWAQTNGMYAWIGWTVNPSEMAIDEIHVRYLINFPELRVIGALWWLWPLLATIAMNMQCGPICTVLYATTPMFLARMITLLFNVEYHPPESSLAHTCRALNIPRILGDCVGESCHADHHSYPMRAKRPSGGFPYADLPYWVVIKPLLLLGLAWSPVDNYKSTDSSRFDRLRVHRDDDRSGPMPRVAHDAREEARPGGPGGGRTGQTSRLRCLWRERRQDREEDVGASAMSTMRWLVASAFQTSPEQQSSPKALPAEPRGT